MLSALPVEPENVHPVRWLNGKFPSWLPPVTVNAASKLPVPEKVPAMSLILRLVKSR